MKAPETVKKFHLLKTGDTVVVAFSGGADSSALLHWLCKERDVHKLTVYAAHIHHGLRGKEADRDEAFVRRCCEKWKVSLFVLHVDVRVEAARTGESEETCGRRLRYAFLEQKAGELHAKIATAHTLSDSIETVLFHLTRGTGLAGLRGIPASRGKIIRPLIETTRAEVEEYCARNTLSFVTDSTNFSHTYARNRIRLDVIPVLRGINPSLERTFSRNMRLFASDEAFLREETERLLKRAYIKRNRPWEQSGFSVSILRGSSLQGRALTLAAARATGFTPEATHVEAMKSLLEKGSGQISLHGKWLAEVEGNRLYFYIPPISLEIQNFSAPFVPGKTKIGPIFLQTSVVEMENINKMKTFSTHYFKNILDCDKINGKVVVRTRKPGDYYHPACHGVGKSLKKLFNEAAIPLTLRAYVPVIVDDLGIIWVGGFGPDMRCAQSASTQKAYFCKTVWNDGEDKGVK